MSLYVLLFLLLCFNTPFTTQSTTRRPVIRDTGVECSTNMFSLNRNVRVYILKFNLAFTGTCFVDPSVCLSSDNMLFISSML